MASYFRDNDFADALLTFVCKDRTFLRRCASMLDPSDFRPRRSQNIERWTIATIALEFWEKYKEPVGKLLRAEILEHAQKANLSIRKRKDLEEYAKKVLKYKPVAAEAIEEKVIAYQKSKLINDSIQHMIDLKAKDQLSETKMIEICQKVTNFGKKKIESSDYFSDEDFERRILKRQQFGQRRYPLLMIDPLDQSIRAVARGQVGLFVGSYSVGKSTFAVHLAQSYAMQALNVIYFTLEDTMDDVTDRLDASLTALPLLQLKDFPNRLRKRFLRMRELLRGRIRVADLTEQIPTVDTLEQVYLQYRNEGFIADAIITDYDKDLKTQHRFEHKWEAYDEIYTKYRLMASKYKLIAWMLSQAVRGTSEKKRLVGDDAEGGLDKMRRAHFGLTGGKGDWGEDSIYLYVPRHKYDRKNIGWNIMGDRSRGIFYDRDATNELIASDEENTEDEERFEERNGNHR